MRAGGSSGQTRMGSSHPAAWKRLLARLIDWAIHFLIILVVITILFTTEMYDSMSGEALALMYFGTTALLRGIFEIGFVATKGGTPGKLALGMRIQSAARYFSTQATWRQATIRGLLIDIPTLFGGVYYTVLVLLPSAADTFIALLSILWGATWVFWLVQVLSIFGSSARRGLHERLAGTVVTNA